MYSALNRALPTASTLQWPHMIVRERAVHRQRCLDDVRWRILRGHRPSPEERAGYFLHPFRVPRHCVGRTRAYPITRARACHALGAVCTGWLRVAASAIVGMVSRDRTVDSTAGLMKAWKAPAITAPGLVSSFLARLSCALTIFAVLQLERLFLPIVVHLPPKRLYAQDTARTESRSPLWRGKHPVLLGPPI